MTIKAALLSDLRQINLPGLALLMPIIEAKINSIPESELYNMLDGTYHRIADILDAYDLERDRIEIESDRNKIES